MVCLRTQTFTLVACSQVTGLYELSKIKPTFPQWTIQIIFSLIISQCPWFTLIIIHWSITANWHPYHLDDGRLQKAINVNNKMHIIEEMVLFQDGQPVQRIELDTEKVITAPRREEVMLALLRRPVMLVNNKLGKSIIVGLETPWAMKSHCLKRTSRSLG